MTWGGVKIIPISMRLNHKGPLKMKIPKEKLIKNYNLEGYLDIFNTFSHSQACKLF